MSLQELKWLTNQDFVHLDVRTSVTRGALGSSEQYAQQASQLGMTTLGLADAETMIDFPDFVRACKQHGIKPLLGARFHLVQALDSPKAWVTSLVAAPVGWDSLTALTAIAQTRRLMASDFRHHQNGLLFIADEQAYPEVVYEINDSPTLHFPVTPWNLDHDVEVANKFEAQMVATNEVWRSEPRPNDLYLSMVLRALGSKEKLDPKILQTGLPPAHIAPNFHPEGWLKSPKDMWRAFGRSAKDLAIATNRIADQVQVHELPPPQLPEYPGGDPDEMLRQRVTSRLEFRYPNPSKAIQDRIKLELDRIRQKHMASIILFADEFARLARFHDIDLFGLGSATGSVVNYILDITNVDPIANGLSFDRFLDEASSVVTDTDFGVDAAKRNGLYTLVQNRVGEMGLFLGHIIIRPKYRVRGAIRSVMRVFAVDEPVISQVLDRLFSYQQLDQPYQSMVQLGLALSEREIYRGSISTHSSKVVITESLPPPGLMSLQKKDKHILFIDKNEAEHWLNVDLVSSQALALINRVCETVGHKRTELDITPAIIKFACTDPIGIPYLETPWLREVLFRHQAVHQGDYVINDLVQAISLSRPAARSSLATYLSRLRQGGWLRTSQADHILSETMGLVIYQDQVLDIAIQAAGFTGAEANELRRGMSKERTGEQFNTLHQRFINGAVANGYTDETAEYLFSMMAEFAKYGFIKGHALSLITNICLPAAWLKHSYPQEFFDQVLKQKTSFYHWFNNDQIYKDEQRRLTTP